MRMDYYTDYFNPQILNCKHNVRPCLLIEALLNKTYIRKNALSTSHPAVQAFYSVTDNMNRKELEVLNKIDNVPIWKILES
jgi:hypothetical protein